MEAAFVRTNFWRSIAIGILLSTERKEVDRMAGGSWRTGVHLMLLTNEILKEPRRKELPFQRNGKSLRPALKII